MNFGSASAKASKAFHAQQPTYLVPPHFSIPPNSATAKGPLDLGTLVVDLQRYRPLNQGPLNRVPIAEDQRYVDVVEDVSNTLNTSSGGEAGIFAKILNQSIGGDASLKSQRTSEDIFTIAKLETRYFYPPAGYAEKCLNLPDVREFNEIVEYREPIYLVTGLKIAWGATVTTSQGSVHESNVKAAIEAPAGVVDLGVGAKSSLSHEKRQVATYGKPRDFVLGVQLSRIRYKKKTWVSKGGLEVKPHAKGAVLVDDDELVVEAETEDEFDAVLEDLAGSELDGYEQIRGADAQGRELSWLIPASGE